LKKSAKNTNNACACGSGKPFAECCQPILDGGVRAATAEQLMRSRYCAYSLHRIDYLRASWHADTCPDDLDEREMAQVKWQELRILDCQAGGVDDNSGTVTFRARFKINGKAGHLQETSRFVRQDGHWQYLDGDIAET
jgi:SEC-C motif-containing protein